jgi:HPt (histidine-containing phosphotransfer) domain-containing protein
VNFQTPQAAEESRRQLLDTLWQRNLPLLAERLTELDNAAEAAATQTLTSQAREAAASTAHKLAGSLGMFGYPNGTDLARSIEQLLEAPIAVDATALRELATALRATLDL